MTIAAYYEIWALSTKTKSATPTKKTHNEDWMWNVISTERTINLLWTWLMIVKIHLSWLLVLDFIQNHFDLSQLFFKQFDASHLMSCIASWNDTSNDEIVWVNGCILVVDDETVFTNVIVVTIVTNVSQSFFKIGDEPHSCCFWWAVSSFVVNMGFVWFEICTMWDVSQDAMLELRS